MVERTTDWRDHHELLACQADPGAFSRRDGESSKEWHERQGAAVKLCIGCRILELCRRETLHLGSAEVVAGGWTTAQIKAILKEIEKRKPEKLSSPSDEAQNLPAE